MKRISCDLRKLYENESFNISLGKQSYVLNHRVQNAHNGKADTCRQLMLSFIFRGVFRFKES